MTTTDLRINLWAEDGRYYFAAFDGDSHDGNGDCPADVATDADAMAWAERRWPGADCQIVNRTY